MEKLFKLSDRDKQNIDFEPWLEQKNENLKPIVRKWFDAIKRCGLNVEIVFHDGYPNGCVENTPFAYINAFTAHVNLGFYQGAKLPNKNRILEGTGKRMRHIKLHPNNDIADEEILTLLGLAYLDIKQRLLKELPY